MFVLLYGTTFWNGQNMSPLHGDQWEGLPCSLRWPCGPETCFFFGCLVCYIFWLEVPKMKPGLGHNLAYWCFYNLMPECVFRGTRTCGGIWKTEVCGVGVGGLSLVEEAELGITCMSGVCCPYQLCLLLLWEGMHSFFLGKSWEWSHGSIHSCPKDWRKNKRLWLALWNRSEQTTLVV